MTLQELINWAHSQGIEDFNKVNLEFNVGDEVRECYIPVEEFALCADTVVNPMTQQPEQFIYINRY